MKLRNVIVGILLIIIAPVGHSKASDHRVYVLSNKQASDIVGKQFCLAECCDINGGGPCDPGQVPEACDKEFYMCYAYGCTNPGSNVYRSLSEEYLDDACDPEEAQPGDQCNLEPDTSDWAGCEHFEVYVCTTVGSGFFATCKTVDTGETTWLGENYECTLDSNDCL